MDDTQAMNPGYGQLDPPMETEPAGAPGSGKTGLRLSRGPMMVALLSGAAVLALALVALAENLVLGHVGREDLLRIAEGLNIQSATNIQAILRSERATPEGAAAGARDALGIQSPRALTLEFLASPQGMPSTLPALESGLDILKVDLLDLNGTARWSTDAAAVGGTVGRNALFQRAITGGIASASLEDMDLARLDGVTRSADVVHTYIPLRATPDGEVIGVMRIYRDVGGDIARQIDGFRSAVLWTTASATGGLFLVLLGIMTAAALIVTQSSRRQLVLAERTNQLLEDRIRQRTRELEEAHERLARTERLAAIGQLVGGVGHDLRNPLGAITNAVYYLRRRLSNSEVARSNPRIDQFLRTIDDEVEHSNKIISDLLTFARVNRPALSPTNLVEVIESALAGIEVRENVHIKKHFEPDLPPVMADGEQIYRVFMNLAVNAQDAMPGGGRLTITARVEDGAARVAFADSGTGITDEDVNKIFEPLFTTKTNGTGLGLAICRQIVAKHRGTIEVTNNHD